MTCWLRCVARWRRSWTDGEVSSNAIASAYKELRELDRLIRSADDADRQEGERRGNDDRTRRSFNASAI